MRTELCKTLFFFGRRAANRSTGPLPGMHLTRSTSTLSENLLLILLARDEQQFQVVLVCKAWSCLSLAVSRQDLALAVSL